MWTIAIVPTLDRSQDYPFAARGQPNGDRSDSGICPNSIDVQDYLANLAVDLSEQFNVRGFVLEGNGIPPYDYGWIRPRLFAPLTPLAKELMRLCFCDSCTTLAKERRDSILRQSGRGYERFFVSVESPPVFGHAATRTSRSTMTSPSMRISAQSARRP